VGGKRTKQIRSDKSSCEHSCRCRSKSFLISSLRLSMLASRSRSFAVLEFSVSMNQNNLCTSVAGGRTSLAFVKKAQFQLFYVNIIPGSSSRREARPSYRGSDKDFSCASFALSSSFGFNVGSSSIHRSALVHVLLLFRGFFCRFLESTISVEQPSPPGLSSQLAARCVYESRADLHSSGVASALL
jgi:hypothetical protein